MPFHETFNTLSHALGALLALIGFIVLLVLAEQPQQTIVYTIYGSSLVLLYSVSALYHALDLTEELQRLMQKLDRTAIALLIAGTATPVGVLTLSGSQAGIFLGILWSITALLILSHFAMPSFPFWVYVIVYLLMGWLGLLVAEPLVDRLSAGGFVWLLVGGIFYTVGAFIYTFDWPSLYPRWFEAHELWHVFCLLGSGAHYVLIVGYTL